MFSPNRKVIRNEIFFAAVLIISLLTPPTFAVNQGPAVGGTAITIEGIHFTQVSVGETVAFGVTNIGTVYAWGDNSFGELGNGSDLVITASNPVQVLTSANTPLINIVEVAAGASFGLARTASGAVYSWGANDSGQLGINSTDNSGYATQVLDVSGFGFLSDATALEANGASAYALKESTGEVYAWGNNIYGQLGNNTVDNSLIPGYVHNEDDTANLTSITKIAAGLNTSFAIGEGGLLWAWGRNNKKQLGDTTTSTRPIPIRVQASGLDLLNVESVSAGDVHGIAQTISGTVYTWGNNTDGATSRGNYIGTSNVLAVSGLSLVTSVVAAKNVSFALRSDGRFYSWGSAANQTLGDGGLKRYTPTLVTTTGVSFTSFVDGTNCMLGLDANGNVYGWGTNTSGLVGDSTTTDRPTPVLGPNFIADQVRFDEIAGTDLTVTGTSWTVYSPAGTPGASVVVVGDASLMAGTTIVDTVSFDAGTFQYEAAPVVETPTPTPDPTTPTPEPTPSDSGTPAPDPTETVEPTPDPITPSPEPSATESAPVIDPSPSDSPTATPEPSPSDTATPPAELPIITPPESPLDEVKIPDEVIPISQVPKSTLANSAPKVTAPLLAIAPKINKKPKVKQPITLTTGNWSGSNSTKTYQWYRCAKQIKASMTTLNKKAKCTAITGATTASYTPIRKDKGKYLLTQVTATNSAGRSSIYTATSAKVK